MSSPDLRAAIDAALQEQEERRQQAIKHLEAALALLGGKQARQVASATARTRQDYATRIVDVLKKNSKPMSPADIAKSLGVGRPQIEQFLFREKKRKPPRIVRLGPGNYGLPKGR